MKEKLEEYETLHAREFSSNKKDEIKIEESKEQVMSNKATFRFSKAIIAKIKMKNFEKSNTSYE